MSITRRVRRSGDVRWEVRIHSHGRVVTQRTFARLADARRWEGDQIAKVSSDGWIDPRRGEIPFAEIAAEWQASRAHLAPRSQETTQFLLDRDVLPALGRLPVSAISSADVMRLLASMNGRGLAVSTQRRTLSVVRLVFDYAIADGRLTTNPARSVALPRGTQRVEPAVLTSEQLMALAAMVPSSCEPVVLVLGLIGLRFSEMAGLVVRDATHTAHGWALRVHRPITQSRRTGALVAGPTKNGHSRTVPVPDALVPFIERRKREATAGAPLFPSPRGGVWRDSNFRRTSHWKESTRAIGAEGLRLHDLRHTAATLLIASGADTKVIQQILGHRSAQMTLDLYGHLLQDSMWRAVRQLPGYPPPVG